MIKKLLSLYADKRLLALLCLGFVSGLPFLLTLSTLSFWLVEVGVSKSSISILMLLGIPYSVKFLWAPLLDHIHIPYLSKNLGNRRAWAIVSHFGLMVSLILLGHSHPEKHLWMTGLASFLVSVFSATLDSVIDAYRIELLEKEMTAIGASIEAIGFRFGMMASGAGALYIASIFDWTTSYTLMAGFMVLGILAILSTPLKSIEQLHQYSDWAKRYKSSWQDILKSPYFFYLLTFIFLFKAIDTVLNAMSAPFLYELGVSKVLFADISKLYGVFLMVIGALLGGLVMRFLGDVYGVLLALVLQMMSSLMFTLQAIIGFHIPSLIISVGVESLTSGLVSAIFIAYISKFCKTPHTASHFTLLYSFGSLSRVLLSSLSAYLADIMQWGTLFFSMSFVAIPAILLLLVLEDKITIRLSAIFDSKAA